jgi:membrane-associated protease RseP (regulator of RpoE activity)
MPGIKIYLFPIIAFIFLLALASEIAHQLQLLGTVTGGKYGGVALIKSRTSNKVEAIRLGGKVFDFGTLTGVEYKAVVLKDKKGGLVRLSTKLGGTLMQTIPNASKTTDVVATGDRYSEEGFQRVGNKTEVDSRYKDRIINQELPKVLMQASSEPVMNGNEIKGFRLFQLEKGSIYEKLGIQDGDVVTEINGVPLNNVAKTVQFLNGLKTENNVTVSVVRNGQPTQLELSVK